MQTCDEPVRGPESLTLRPLDLGDQALARRLLELQRRAYAAEAELIGSGAIPALHETLEQLVHSGESFLGAFLGDRLVGAISWKRLGRTIDLHRLVVDPGFFRCGVGTALLRRALASEPGSTRAIVQTGAANLPARRLYEREGFSVVEELEVAPGLAVTRLERALG